MRCKSVEEAHRQFLDLLAAAENGHSTLVIKHGRPVAALTPVEACRPWPRQQSLIPLKGSGRGLWDKDSARTLRRLRAEWSV